MGSGEFAEQGYKKASFFRNITTTDQYNRPVEPQVSTIATKVNCYNIKQGASGTSWGVNFYYGGPGGQNANCRWFGSAVCSEMIWVLVTTCVYLNKSVRLWNHVVQVNIMCVLE